MKKRKRILVIEPYYGGSHQAFLDGLLENIECDFKLISLPARKWKMRMQMSAPWFVSQISALEPEARYFDTVLCSTFVNVAVLRALVGQVKGWNPKTQFCTYFHENQFAYPGRVPDKGIQQFTAINFTTALASDRLAFNSAYNMNTFLDRSYFFVKKAADMSIIDWHDGVRDKSIVLHPGIDFSHIDAAPDCCRNGSPVIVWNHRWEHDKNPDEFFAALYSLKNKGIDFRLIVLGESFKNMPECFVEGKEELSEQIIHYGYAESAKAYGELLKQGDIVVSTAHHEFFGISVLEAVRAGCVPLLPDRLSYPELFPEEFLYSDSSFENTLERLLGSSKRMSRKESEDLTESYGWVNIAEKYRDWLFGSTACDE
ncbi:tRNA-queuosine alpha-mannosyltransferase domain-containing protein [Desulfosediminicola flagellatus]|uniref:tRNA-queuosine alpha-mannosyltransferase domain-containing protein n=1 Tax=Desulfosediminicola flagellatus TaxID=2569541 RepID=UPI0010AD0F0C|nr:DUF3524 domain-containing protein [Desulfosediminicola flagellatus]